MKKEHTVGFTGTEPVVIEEISETVTESYYPFVVQSTLDKAYRASKDRKLAVVAYDVHRIIEPCGLQQCKIVAYCHPYVIPPIIY